MWAQAIFVLPGPNAVPVYNKDSINVCWTGKKEMHDWFFFCEMKTNGPFPIDFMTLLEKSQWHRRLYSESR